MCSQLTLEGMAQGCMVAQEETGTKATGLEVQSAECREAKGHMEQKERQTGNSTSNTLLPLSFIWGQKRARG